MSRRMALLAAVVVASAVLPRPPAAAAAAAATYVTLPGCTSHCGDISIPYPFGVEPRCYVPGLKVTCRNDSSVGHHHGSPKLFLGDGTVEVLEISIPNATVRINASFAYFPGTSGKDNLLGPNLITSDTWSGGALREGGLYSLDLVRNRMLVYACNALVSAVDYSNTTVGACGALCDWDEEDQTWTYAVPGSGVSFCEATILRESFFYDFNVLWMNTTATRSPVVVWISDREFYPDDNNPGIRLPAVLEWRVNHTTCQPNPNGHDGWYSTRSAACRSRHSYCLPAGADPGPQDHICQCAKGYQGNPYIPNGCTDVNECDDPNTYPCYGVCINTEGSYECKCPPGLKGNASLPNGCKDIDECAHPDRYPCYGDCINMVGTFQCLCKHGTYGDPFTKGGCSSHSGLKIGLIGASGATTILILALVGPVIIKIIKQRKVKAKFFKQNHGLLLRQLISRNANISERMIIALRDLEKATNNFDSDHVVGGGGHGVVFKGNLDQYVVAIKKSKIVVQKEIDEFINEVVILSQVNHRNVVKLLGCCLEIEVPLLVYEFISNGTLYHHLHVEGPISWKDRMRIALEVARALSYMHSSASMPIFHRDIKSSNILLDDSLSAKVSDFGASRYIQIDETGVTTAIQGTIGYLDPMYYNTGRLTDKSDVFSFGVLLIELLTRKKPSVYRYGDNGGLVLHFTSLLKECNLIDIMDPQVMEEEDGEVEEVATLASMCTNWIGEDRPTMREVEMALETLLIKNKKIPCNATIRRCDEDENMTHCMSIEVVPAQASRRYSMEQEMLSARYHR